MTAVQAAPGEIPNGTAAAHQPEIILYGHEACPKYVAPCTLLSQPLSSKLRKIPDDLDPTAPAASKPRSSPSESPTP
jgi:hypothetical protein